MEDLIAGAGTATAADADLSLIARNNRLQAGLAADRRRDWSRHIWRVIFETDPTVEARLEALPATAVVLDRVRALSRGLREVALPTSDLVHGDCVQDNVLIKDGTAYLIDAEHCGKGPRAHDLATLLFEATVGGRAAPSAGCRARASRRGAPVEHGPDRDEGELGGRRRKRDLPEAEAEARQVAQITRQDRHVAAMHEQVEHPVREDDRPEHDSGPASPG